jgi:hypothetical protein
MPFITGIVQAVPKQSAGPGSSPQGVFLGRLNELVVSELHGKYFTQARDGNVFHGTTAPAGAAIPINTTTAPTCFLWNPSNSTAMVVPIAWRAGLASGTGVAAGIGYNVLTGAGPYSLNTIVTAFTPIVPICSLIGGGQNSQAKFGSTVTIVTTNASFLRSTGISQGAPITTTAAIFNMVDIFDGETVLLPGTAIYPVGNAATGDLYIQSFTWVEVPFP